MSIYDTLNDRQLEAVYHTDGPLLILAGAGSGKTRVLTHRAAFLIEEKQVEPWNIMAITFTNKAAREMRDRIDNIVGYGAESIWVHTFHSSCVRILRKYIDRIGYDNNFTIYDTDDVKAVIKEVCKKLNIDSKYVKEKTIMNEISAAKNAMMDAEEYMLENAGDFNKRQIASAYKEYENRMRMNNALDFDDLLLKTVELFEQCPEVLAFYQERFQYIMVDEYQDTNTVQFRLVRLLADKYRNLCVVGDDDQSIYRFRGADIRNILDFERVYPDAKVIKLEQNYRSTGNILNAANSVIAHNRGRKEKALWTEKENGDKIIFRQVDNAFEEAELIADEIDRLVRKGRFGYGDCACLYRTNAQSRMLEERFIRENIPYRIFGGVNYYQRKEVKDMIAYLKTIENGKDDVAVRRIINVPKRGIGATTIERVAMFADSAGINFYEALMNQNCRDILGRSASKIIPFVDFIQLKRAQAKEMSISELLERIIEDTGYVKELQIENTDESKARIENIDELISKVADYEMRTDEPTLSGFLEEVALIADIDNLDENSEYVSLMTIHSAKGLEFPKVFLCGLEEGLFPSMMSSFEPTEVEEERRLCYVAITRAMESLTITSARSRMIRGEFQYNKVSRFVSEIDGKCLDSNISSGSLKRANQPSNERRSVNTNVILKEKAFVPEQYKVTRVNDLEYTVGDKVHHIKFGDGIVTMIYEGGKDYEVTVEFEKYGIKKMFASFAKLKKV